MNRVVLLCLLTWLMCFSQTVWATGNDYNKDGNNAVYNKLYVHNLKVVKKKGKQLILKFSITNIGSQEVDLKDAFTNLQFHEGENLERVGISQYASNVRNAIIAAGGSFKPKQSYNKTLKINLRKSYPNTRGFEAKSSNKKEKKKKTKRKGKHQQDVFVSTTSPKPSKKEVRRSTKKDNTYKQSQKVAAASNTALETKVVVEEGCKDLSLSNIKVLKKRKKRWADIEYTITNNGSIPIALNGNRKDKYDDLGLKVHLSGDQKLNKGDIVAGGAFVTDRMKRKESKILGAGQSYTGVMRISLQKQTSFTAVLIVMVDALQTVEECDETNNQSFVISR